MPVHRARFAGIGAALLDLAERAAGDVRAAVIVARW